jgi:ABC-type Fe3+ transport system substrate-binding protein
LKVLSTTRARRASAAAALVSVALVLSACGGSDGKASTGGAGKAEDKVIVYYTTRPEDGLPPLQKAFEDANPGYKLQIIRGSSSDSVARLLTEAQAGKQQADVVELNSLPMAQLAEADLLAKLPDSIIGSMPDNAKSPDGVYVGTRYFGNTTPYNTDLVPKADQPKSYEDFLKPYWKGKFVVGANDVEWAYQVYASKGEAEAKKFFEKIKAQKPQIRDEGRGALAELVGIGQIRASIMTLSYHVTNRQKLGMPIAAADWDPPLLNIDWLATFKASPHPSSTQVFLKWLFSKDGIATDAGLGFNRIGDAGTEAALNQPGLLVLDPATAADQEKAAKAFSDVFSIG